MKDLTHWGWVTNLYIDNLTIIGSDNGLSPGRCQAIIWTNAGLLIIGPLRRNFSEILNKINTVLSMKMRLKMPSTKWQPLCLGLKVLEILSKLLNEMMVPQFALSNILINIQDKNIRKLGPYQSLIFLCLVCTSVWVNSSPPRQNGCHFADDIFKWISLTENVSISMKISLNFVPRGPINNNPTLVQIVAWRWPGGKPLSEPMMVRLPMNICITWPQWVNIPGQITRQSPLAIFPHHQ